MQKSDFKFERGLIQCHKKECCVLLYIFFHTNVKFSSSDMHQSLSFIKVITSEPNSTSIVCYMTLS